MKKNFVYTILFFVLCFLVVPYSSCSAKDQIITFSELPKPAQTFITTNFQNMEFLYVMKDDNEFKVKFQNGWEVEFDSKGNWDKIDCKNAPIPSDICAQLPAKLLNYLKEHFKNAQITEIDKDFFGYDIELDNGLDLEFSKKGDIKEIDD